MMDTERIILLQYDVEHLFICYLYCKFCLYAPQILVLSTKLSQVIFYLNLMQFMYCQSEFTFVYSSLNL